MTTKTTDEDQVLPFITQIAETDRLQRLILYYQYKREAAINRQEARRLVGRVARAKIEPHQYQYQAEICEAKAETLKLFLLTSMRDEEGSDGLSRESEGA